ncbi:unnamed protein product (mitochondrion) [Plasmodiophora brassicae]|uniref:CTLH domain-containing protein n=1 Tax=Plasmodiophora brassicae TaxID=37360 RepID=A0A3P3Y1F0_PLABS|nr:unnamed protein product [Plasmodiophora brassicae]
MIVEARKRSKTCHGEADPVVTPAGYRVRRSQLVRAIEQALRDLGHVRALSALETESRVTLQTPTSVAIADWVRNSQWDQLLAALPSLSWADGSHLEKATAEIVRYQFFELCNEGRYVEAIECLRRGPPYVHALSRFVMFSNAERLRSASGMTLEEKSLSKANVLSLLQEIINQDDFIEDARLLTLVDNANGVDGEMGDRHEVLTTPAGVWLCPYEWTRILLQSVRDLGFSTTYEVLVEESGVTMEHALATQVRQDAEYGQWDRVLDCLSVACRDSHNLDEARRVVLKQKFFELCERNHFTEAVECLRQSPSELAGLSRFLMFPDPARIRAEAGLSGDVNMCRSQTISTLEALLDPGLFLKPDRLLSIIDDAMQYQIGQCLFHNERTTTAYILKRHQCSCDNIPSYCAEVVEGHTDEVWFVQFSHDGKRLATASRDSTVRIWEFDEPRGVTVQQHCLRGHSKRAYVSYVSWSDDDSLLVTCGTGRQATVWDTHSGAKVCRLKGHREQVLACAWVPKLRQIVTGSVDQYIMLWNTDGERLYSWRMDGAINDLCVAKDGSVMLAGSTNLTVHMFNLETKQATECLREPTQTIIAFSMSSDASHVLLNVVKPPAIHMWRINPRDSQGRATLVRKFIGATQDRFIVRSAFGGVDENFVISGSEDSNVYIWHRHSGTLLVNLHGHKSSVNSVSWSPTNPFMVASASDDFTIRIWKARKEMERDRDEPALTCTG